MLPDPVEFYCSEGGDFSFMNRYLSTVRPSLDWCDATAPCVVTVDSDPSDGEVVPLTFSSAFPGVYSTQDWNWGPIASAVLTLPSFAADMLLDVLGSNGTTIELFSFDLIFLECASLVELDPLVCAEVVARTRSMLGSSELFADREAVLIADIVAEFSTRTGTGLISVLELLPVGVSFDPELIAATLSVSLEQ